MKIIISFSFIFLIFFIVNSCGKKNNFDTNETSMLTFNNFYMIKK